MVLGHNQECKNWLVVVINSFFNSGMVWDDLTPVPGQNMEKRVYDTLRSVAMTGLLVTFIGDNDLVAMIVNC